MNRLSIFASHHNHPRASFLPFDFRLSTFGLILIFSFLIFQCGLDVEDSTPPSAPVWVQKSLPEEWPERGIDAHESGGIILEWEANPYDENIAKYYIYRAEYLDIEDSLSEFELLTTVNVSSVTTNQYVDQNILVEMEYYYKLLAEDYSQNKSSFSDSLNYMILPAIGLDYMVPNGLEVSLGGNRALTWTYAYIAMQNYCITLLANDEELLARKVLLPGNYIGGIETWIIPDEIILSQGAIYKWRIDMEGQHHMSLETAGSESPWAKFIYQGS